MSDSIIPFRPKSDSRQPQSIQERMEELEQLESLLELMREYNVHERGELERRINALEAALEKEDDPNR